MKELKELYLQILNKEYLEICYNYEKTNGWPKAKKDAVGEIYEKFRIAVINKLFNNIGIVASKGGPLDLTIYRDGKIIAFEEDKGHYVDRCFFERFLSNTSRIINENQHANKESPYLILHSPTKYNRYRNVLKIQLDTIQEKIQRELINKIKYLTLCNHDRVTIGYLKTSNLGFRICEENIEREINFFLGLK